MTEKDVYLISIERREREKERENIERDQVKP
jgi:hypothetical protein